MSKRNYRKFLIEKQEHLVELKERTKKHFIFESAYENEERIKKSLRNHIFADLKAIFGDEYGSYLSPYRHLISFIPAPKMTDEERNDISAFGDIGDIFIDNNTKMLHPFVRFAWQFRSKCALDNVQRKGIVHLLSNIKRSNIFNDDNTDSSISFTENIGGVRNDARAMLKGIISISKHREKWINNPDFWKPEGETPVKQFLSLVKFLLCKYPMPEFFNEIWFQDSSEDNTNYQKWYVNIAQGENLRAQKDLPVPVTKKIAHYFMKAPCNYSIPMAFKWGQIHAMGGNERIVNGVFSTPLKENFAHNEFWQTVIKFFVDNPMLDTEHYRNIYDYIRSQKFCGEIPPQPNFSMHGRTPQTLLAQVENWHEEMNRRREAINQAVLENAHLANYVPFPHRTVSSKWDKSCISDLVKDSKKIPDNGDVSNIRENFYSIKEITSQTGLEQEGMDMHHCVGSYASSCSTGRVAIFSFSMGKKSKEKKLLTIEVSLERKEIVQMRGVCNASYKLVPDYGYEESSVVREWMEKNELKLSAYC